MKKLLLERALVMNAAVKQNPRQPAFSAPAGVLALIAVLIVIHVLREFLPPDYDSFVTVMFGVLPARYLSGVISSYPGGVWAAIPPFITYAFLHAGYAHLLVNCAWLMAFGSAVSRVLGNRRFLLLYLVCAVVAAIVHAAADRGSMAPMIGASGAIAGMMGAAFRVALPRVIDGAYEAAPRHGHQIPLLPLSDRRFLLLSGVWIVTNIIFGLTGIRISEQVLMIAWDAHIAGFLAGALLVPWFIRQPRVINITPR